ncbi:3D domain-containing protein [Calderihabitans maritimus]|uniref:3D domain-containing protein n=1 Tax=Calderihabitans maritimus TaxID=1246530 RepID=A0A1Z5HVP0_9FIRM|nr:3D domain-containing protein [Calderihabitans maritimus]GAW93613.1 hypothetical protein HM1_2466 [Calderihabitans maritimus]
METLYVLTRWQLAGHQIWEPMEVTATAYDACLSCTGKVDGITRTGTRATPGRTIAVDPAVIPLGAIVYIPELDTVFTAEDTGGKIKGPRIDIFFSTHEEALKFGVKKLTVYVITRGDNI